MKIIMLFLLGIFVATAPIFVKPHENKHQNNEKHTQQKNGFIVRFMQAHPIMAAAVITIPLFFLFYKWRKALGMNADLLAYNQACELRERRLVQQLLHEKLKSEELENLIETMFKQMNDSFKLYHQS